MRIRKTQKRVNLAMLLALLCIGLFAVGFFAITNVSTAQAQTDTFSESFEKDDTDMAPMERDAFFENMEDNTIVGLNYNDPASQYFDSVFGPYDTDRLLENLSEPIDNPNWTWTIQDGYSFALGDMTIPNIHWPSPFDEQTEQANPYHMQTWPGMIRGRSRAQTYAPEETLTLQQKRTQLEKLATLVKDDLTFLGKTVTHSYLMTKNAEYDYNRIKYSGDNHIAIRIWGWMDYHFMRFQSDWGEWRHKPSDSANSVILRHGRTTGVFASDQLYTSLEWVNEEWIPIKNSSVLNYKRPTCQYPGDIIIISYKDADWQTNTSDEVISIIGSATELYDTAIIPQKLIINSVKMFDGIPRDQGILGSTITSITSIGNHPDLKELHIPGTITDITCDAFNGLSNLERIVVVPYNKIYYSNDCGVLFKRGVAGTADELVFIPPKSSGTFNYNGLTIQDCKVTSFTPQIGFSGNLIIPDGITAIGNGAFSDVNQLFQIVIPASVTTIGVLAFENCTSLGSDGSVIYLPSSVTNIGLSAFSGCISLESITLPFVGASRTAIGNNSRFGYIFGTSYYSGASQTNQNGITYYIPYSLKTVNILEGSINYSAFYNCSSLTTIKLPENLTNIGDNVFYNCSSLANLAIPSNINAIGNYAFYNCRSLNVSMPSSVINIGEYAFYGCSNLTTVTIPAGVTEINSNIFWGCSKLTNVSVASENSVYKSDGNCIIQKSDNKLIMGCKNTVVPNYVSAIGSYAFAYCNLGSLEIPASVTKIESYAFTNSSVNNLTFSTGSNLETIFGYAFYAASLNNVIIPASVSEIYNYAFSECNLGSLTFENNSDLTTINDYAFYKCDMYYICLPASVTTIGKRSFAEATIGTFSFGTNSNVTNIGAYAFHNVATNRIIIPASVKTIGEWCFGNGNIQFVEFAENSQLTSIGNSVFYGCGFQTITIPDSVKTIGNLAFGYCGQLQNVLISPNSKLYTISGGAFMECISLRGIVLPNSLVSIESRAFYHCASLASVKFYSVKDSQLSYIGYGAFLRASSLKNIIIPASITRIEGVSLWAPEAEYFGRVSKIYYCGKNSNTWNKLFRFEYERPLSGTVYYYSEEKPQTEGLYWYDYQSPTIWREGIKDGLLYTLNDDDNTYSVKAASTDITSANIQERFNGKYVTNIIASGFINCNSLTNITIQNSIKTIGANAFLGCNMLTIYTDVDSANIPIGWSNSWNNSNRPVFWGCTLYTYVDSFTKTANSISNSNAINGISAPSIEEHIFDGWYYYVGSSLTKYANNIASAPNNVTYYAKWLPMLLEVRFNLDGGIGDYPTIRAYNGTMVSEPLDVPEKEGFYFKYWALSSNKTQAFDFDTTITSNILLIAIWGEITYNYSLINNGQSYEISKGTINPNGIVVIPEDYNGLPVTKIANNAFIGSFLTTIIIPASITTIGNDAFFGCTNLKSITFKDGSLLMSIGAYAFYNCTSLTEISIPNGVITIGNKAFENTSLSKILIPNETASVATNAFEGTAITNIVKWTGLFANGTSAIVTTDELTLIFDKEFTGLDMFSNITLSRATINTLSFSGFSYTLSIFDLITGNEGVLEVSLTAPSGVALIGMTKQVTTFDATIYTAGLSFSLIDDATAYEVSVGNALDDDNTIIVIPPAYNGLLVTKIADEGFINCTDLTKVIIPPSVKIIGNSAFSGCTGLTFISLPNSLVVIGNNSFYNCTALTSVELPYSLTIIGDFAFYNCIELTEIVIPYGTTYLGWFAFYNCIGLTNVYLPGSLDVIEVAAFAGCIGLTSIIIPEGVTRINSYAFKDCINLTNVIIPSSLVSIGSRPFFNCPAVIEFPFNIPSFGPEIIFWP